MNKKRMITVVMFVSLGIFIILVWPTYPSLQENQTKQLNSQRQANSATTSRQPQRGSSPDFKEQIIKASKEKDQAKKFFRITSPQAIAYNENHAIAVEHGPGATPAITSKQIDESVQLQSSIAATSNPKEFGSQFSPLVQPKNFNKQRYQTDPKYKEKYLAIAEPGRIYQVDDSSTFSLKRHSPYYQEVVQGESVFLSVQAEPGMPVSITSFDLGKFGNHLTHQTIESDSSGQATFEFFGMSGSFNDSNILVSSPTAKGQIKFIVHTKINTNQQTNNKREEVK